jgi:hypothetical protein
MAPRRPRPDEIVNHGRGMGVEIELWAHRISARRYCLLRAGETHVPQRLLAIRKIVSRRQSFCQPIYGIAGTPLFIENRKSGPDDISLIEIPGT